MWTWNLIETNNSVMSPPLWNPLARCRLRAQFLLQQLEQFNQLRQSNQLKHLTKSRRFNSSCAQLIVTPKSGLVDEQVNEPYEEVLLDLTSRWTFLEKAFPPRLLLSSELTWQERRTRFTSAQQTGISLKDLKGHWFCHQNIPDTWPALMEQLTLVDKDLSAAPMLGPTGSFPSTIYTMHIIHSGRK